MRTDPSGDRPRKTPAKINAASMPRKARQLQVGDIVHVMNRGIEKRTIFLKNQDYSRFVLALEFFNTKEEVNMWNLIARAGSVPARARLDKQRKKNKQCIVDLLAFTLMPNHYHLIVREMINNGLALFMKKMGGYSTYFNKQYNRVGPLFQSRYKTVIVNDDIQLANVFSYVHTNPIELWEPAWKEYKINDASRAMDRLECYRWSSYRDYIGYSAFPYVTNRKFFQDFFGGLEFCKKTVEDWVAFKTKSIGKV